MKKIAIVLGLAFIVSIMVYAGINETVKSLDENSKRNIDSTKHTVKPYIPTTAGKYLDNMDNIAIGYLDERTETNFDVAIAYKITDDDLALLQSYLPEIQVDEKIYNYDKDTYLYRITFFNEGGDMLYFWVVTADREIITEEHWKLTGEKLYSWLNKMEEQGEAALNIN